MDGTNQTITALLHLAASLNRSIPIPLLIFGTIGNALNVLILTRASLRNNSCVFYFLSSTIANIICLWVGLLTRLLSGYNLDPTVWNTLACQFRFYITYMSLSLSAFFLVYASIDRWASSSSNVHIRLFSRIHIARRLVVYTILSACVFYGETFYCYASVLNQFPISCYCPNQICRIYNDILFLVLFSSIPPIVMLIFGYKTIENVKNIHRQVRPSTVQNLNQRNRLMEKKDQQMMIMLLVQVIFFVLCVTPSGISQAFTTLTLNQDKDALELTKETFFFQVSVLILYINCCSAFYLYTLTGRIFRREMKRLLRNMHRASSTTLSEAVVIQKSQIPMTYLKRSEIMMKNT